MGARVREGAVDDVWRLGLAAWKTREPFLGIRRFMRERRVELDGKEKGGAVGRMWFLTFGLAELSRVSGRKWTGAKETVELEGFQGHLSRRVHSGLGVVTSPKVSQGPSLETVLQVTEEKVGK